MGPLDSKRRGGGGGGGAGEGILGTLVSEVEEERGVGAFWDHWILKQKREEGVGRERENLGYTGF